MTAATFGTASSGYPTDYPTSANTASGGDGGAGEMVSFDADSNSTLTVSTSGSGGSKGALTVMSAGGAGGDRRNRLAFYGEEGVGGNGGDGGEIKVTFDGTVTATTSGDDAFGLMFESSGGDGGVAYDFGDGDGGVGGAIDVGIIEANITTTGSGHTESTWPVSAAVAVTHMAAASTATAVL